MKIKFLSIFLAFAMMFVGFSQIGKAAQGDTSLIIDDSNLAPSESFDVELHLDTGGSDIGAFNMYLDFDATDVSIDLASGDDGISLGADATNYSIMANPDDIANGHYRFAGICAQNCANVGEVHLVTIHLETTAGFNSGNSDLFIRINELADELGLTINPGTLTGVTITSNVPDTTAPVRSNETPTSGTLSSGTTETTISLSTDENASCKYSGSASVAYASMTNNFSTTGSASHSTVVTNLSDGNSYDYYVRCEDEYNNENTSDVHISFSVSVASSGNDSSGGGGATDTSVAVLSNGVPSGPLSSDTSETIVAVNTNESATCKYSNTQGVAYASMTNDFDSTGNISHSFSATGLIPGGTYIYYIRCQNVANLVTTEDYTVSFSIKNSDNQESNYDSEEGSDPTESDSGDDTGNKAESGSVDIVSNDFTATTLTIKERGMYERLKGKIILKVEDDGRAYYIHPQTEIGFYLGRPRDAFNVMREQGVGITNADLNKIPFGLDRLMGEDSDGDGLPDLFEGAIGTDKNKADTDGDGYSDRDELGSGYSPLGTDELTSDAVFASKHTGKIFLQVEGSGEAWYIHEGKRYYLGRPDGAFEIMRYLSLGISNTDFNRFSVEK